MARIDAQLRLQRDRIGAEVRDMLGPVGSGGARPPKRRTKYAPPARSKSLSAKKFALGDSTLFVVNLREQATFGGAARDRCPRRLPASADDLSSWCW